MTEKSGIEMLQEILQRLSVIEQRLDIMDKNIKTIANSAKISSLIEKISNTPLDGWAKAIKPGIKDIKEKVNKEVGFKNFHFEATDAAKIKEPQAAQRSARPIQQPGNILVTGKLKIERNGTVVALPGVSVKIFDTSDKMIKNTKTNKAGHWMSHLPPGKYVALFEGELNGKKLVPQNKNFEVPFILPAGKTEFEVV